MSSLRRGTLALDTGESFIRSATEHLSYTRHCARGQDFLPGPCFLFEKTLNKKPKQEHFRYVIYAMKKIKQNHMKDSDCEWRSRKPLKRWHVSWVRRRPRWKMSIGTTRTRVLRHAGACRTEEIGRSPVQECVVREWRRRHWGGWAGPWSHESLAGHGKEFGFYSKMYWEATEWFQDRICHDLICVLKSSLWLPRGKWTVEGRAREKAEGTVKS